MQFPWRRSLDWLTGEFTRQKHAGRIERLEFPPRIRVHESCWQLRVIESLLIPCKRFASKVQPRRCLAEAHAELQRRPKLLAPGQQIGKHTALLGHVELGEKTRSGG